MLPWFIKKEQELYGNHAAIDNCLKKTDSYTKNNLTSNCALPKRLQRSHFERSKFEEQEHGELLSFWPSTWLYRLGEDAKPVILYTLTERSSFRFIQNSNNEMRKVAMMSKRPSLFTIPKDPKSLNVHYDKDCNDVVVNSPADILHLHFRLAEIKHHIDLI